MEETEGEDNNQDEGDSTYSREGQIEPDIPNPDDTPSQPAYPRWLDPALAEEYIVPDKLQKSRSISATHSAASLDSRSSPNPFLESARQTRSSSRYSEPSRSFTSTPFLGTRPTQSKEMLEKENQDLRRRLAETEVQRDAAETHAVFASRQAAVAQYKLNKTKEKTTGKSIRFPTSSRVVTSQQGRDEAKKYEESRKKKQDAAQKKKLAKRTKEREDLVRRSTLVKTMTFTGSLSSFPSCAKIFPNTLWNILT